MSIKSIPTGAFISKSTITSVKFGSQCSYVGINAFKDCISLNEINDDNSIEEIEANAFAGTNLYSVNFNNLSTIGVSAFDKCSNLTYVNATNCQKVGNYAFQNCSNLQQIDIQSCDNIGRYAFNECSNLKSVNINTSVEIKNCAFYKCIKLSDIDFKNCNKIENLAFYMCSNIKIANLTNCIRIGTGAFAECSNFEQITLSQTTIGNGAFLNCNNLKKVYIQTKQSEKCIELGNSVFCNSIEGGQYEIISNIKFYLGVDIISKYKNNPVWSMYSSHFVELPGLHQIVYTTNDNTIIEIDDNTNIESHKYDTTNKRYIIEFKKSDEESEQEFFKLNQQIFNGENKLTSVELPPDCDEIGNREFENCVNLNSFTQQSNNLTKIGEYAFKNCKSLESFEIPESVTDLGEGVFAGCSKIEKFEGKFISYGGKAVVKDGTLICVLPKDDNDTEGRYYNISDIDSTITKLGKSCFYGCKELRRIDLYSNIEEIGDNAFDGCENLREVHMGSIIPRKIGSNVFGNNKDFKIFVPENKYASYCAKWKNTEYEQYIYPKPNNKSIIYYGDEKLTSDSLVISNNNYTNGEYYKISNIKNALSSTYFSGKSSVKKVIIGEDITELNNRVFKNCKSLEYIYIPDTINKFGDECFYNCEKLIRIHIPNSNYIQQTQTINSKSTKSNINIEIGGIQNFSGSTTYFGDNIFYGCTSLKEFGSYHKGFVSDDNMCYVDCGVLKFFAPGGLTPIDETISYTIPDNITEINKNAFNGVNINNITISESTKIIGENAFANCSNLTSINSWDNVEIISKGAFMNCYDSINEKGLGAISLPNNLKIIEENAFSGCVLMELNDNTVLENVITIGKSAFKNCGISGDLKLNNIQSINESVFRGCSNLTSVSINDNVETIDKEAFCDCKNLTSIIINTSSNLKSINNSAFRNCGNLTTLYIPDSVDYLGNYAFEKCSNYKGTGDGLKLPDNLTIIGTCCFRESGIETLNILENCKLTTISTGAFSNCKELKNVDLSKSTKLTTISSEAFYSSSNLNKLSLSNTITSIGDYAFRDTKLSEILLPSSISKLGHYCFDTNADRITINMKNLLTVEPPIFTKSGSNDVNSYPFGDINGENVLNLYLPSMSNTIINKYKTNKYWEKYKDYITQRLIMVDVNVM